MTVNILMFYSFFRITSNWSIEQRNERKNMATKVIDLNAKYEIQIIWFWKGTKKKVENNIIMIKIKVILKFSVIFIRNNFLIKSAYVLRFS